MSKFSLKINCNEFDKTTTLCEGKGIRMYGAILVNRNRGFCDVKQKGNLNVVDELIDYIKPKCKNL